MAENHSTGALSTGTEATPPSEHGGGFPPFQKETFGSQLLWLAIFFIALYVIASRLALPRVGGIIADRRKRISNDLAEAARMKDAADAAIANYEKALADARARAQAMAAQTRDKLNAEAEERRKALEASLHAKLTTAEQSIAETRTAAMANVQAIAQEAAIAIVTQLTGKAPSEAAAAAAVKAAINR
jgi:F-type H+-transporting ATPase subunit b